MTSARLSVAHVTTVDMSLRYLLLNQLLWLKRNGYEVTGISAPGPHVRELEAAGIRHIAVPMTRSMAPAADLRALTALRRVFARQRFDIVHTHTPKPNLFGQLAARMAGVPHVLSTVHGYYFHDEMPWSRRRFFVALEKVAAACSDIILSQNPEDIETAVRERIAPRRKLRFLGNGIDISAFRPELLSDAARAQKRHELGVSSGAPVVGFVGRLVAEKGLLELFQAARHILSEHPNARFLVIGPSDPAKPDSLGPEEAARLGVGKAFVFAGLRQDMPALYATMDVFVLPSHREGFPRSPMEAAASGLPVVVTNVRGCRETVLPGTSGLMFEKGDVDGLARAVCDILRERERARRFGAAGRQLAEQKFDESHVFERVLSAYGELAGRPTAVAAAGQLR